MCSRTTAREFPEKRRWKGSGTVYVPNKGGVMAQLLGKQYCTSQLQPG
jgi:hypothetical protein